MENTDQGAINFVLQVESLYWELMERARAEGSHSEPNLGGTLLYVGEFDEPGRALVIAANVAGAATMVATADLQAQRQAIREGVVDFLVTSLDEALRILKNEIRKRDRVAVCVALAPEAIEREMRERGVRPDLLGAELLGSDDHPGFPPTAAVWSVEAAPAHWLPKLDALALECLDASQAAERRWLRNAPRHFGRMAFRLRALSGGSAFASSFIERVRAAVGSGEVNTAVDLQQRQGCLVEELRFTPLH